MKPIEKVINYLAVDMLAVRTEIGSINEKLSDLTIVNSVLLIPSVLLHFNQCIHNSFSVEHGLSKSCLHFVFEITNSVRLQVVKALKLREKAYPFLMFRAVSFLNF